jgi:DNA repair exonuclease SbcCD ATPase subunit
MPRKKRLTPKDKKILLLERTIESHKSEQYGLEYALGKAKKELETEKENFAVLMQEKNRLQRNIGKLADNFRNLNEDVRQYGQPVSQKPRRNPKTGEWSDPEPYVELSADRFIGYLQGRLKGFAMEAREMDDQPRAQTWYK